MKRALLIMATALAILAGCNQRPAEPEVATDFCPNLEAFGDALVRIEEVSAGAALDDLRTARQAAAVNRERLLQAAQAQASGVRTDALQDAWDSLAATIDAVSDETALAAAGGDLVQGLAAVRAAYDFLARTECPELAATEEKAALAPWQAAQPEAAGAEAPGIPGTYSGAIQALDGSQQTLTLTLHPDSAASLVYSGAPARDGSEQAISEVILEGTWAENPDGTVSAALDRLAGGVELAVPDTFTFSRQDDLLVALEYDQQGLGAGLTLQRVGEMAASPEPALSATGSDPVGAGEAGAPQPGSAGPEAASLAGVTWQLQQIRQAGGNVAAVSDPGRYTLTLMPDGTMTAQADCSAGGGLYETRDGQISFVIEWTAELCPPPSLQRQFIKYLEYADVYTVQQDSLAIGYSNASGTLLFRATDQ